MDPFNGLLQSRHRVFRRADPRVWALMLSTARRARMHMAPVVPRDDYAIRMTQELVWTPGTPAQYIAARPGIFNPLQLLHEVMHHLCFTHGGSDTRGRPESILFYENIACNIDTYFAASIVQREGTDVVRERMLDLHPFSTFVRTNARLALGKPRYFAVLEREEPFALYKQMVTEVDRIQATVRRVLRHFEPARARRESLEVLEASVAKLPRLIFSSYFNHLLHVTFARFNGGTRATKADLAAKRRCQQALARASSLADFMLALGAPPAAPPSRRRA